MDRLESATSTLRQRARFGLAVDSVLGGGSRWGARAAAEFREDLDALLDSFRASQPFDRRQPVQVAGDPEYTAAKERERNGIPLCRSVIEDIRTVCHECCVPFFLGTG